MSVIFLLIAASTLVALFFLFAFICAVHTGQFDDDKSPAVRMLLEDRVREKDENGGWPTVGIGPRSPSANDPSTQSPITAPETRPIIP